MAEFYAAPDARRDTLSVEPWWGQSVFTKADCYPDAIGVSVVLK